MIRLTRQNMGPVPTSYRTLGQVSTVQTDAGAVAGIVTSLSKLFGGQSHPWIPAQNSAESQIANIVQSYVNLKNVSQLTANYIANAMTNVATISKGFAQFVQQYNSAAANQGASDIANNANAVIQNMEQDLVALQVNPIVSVFGGGPPVITNTTSSGPGGVTPTITPTVTNISSALTSPAVLGLAALFFLPRLFKG